MKESDRYKFDDTECPYIYIYINETLIRIISNEFFDKIITIQ